MYKKQMAHGMPCEGRVNVVKQTSVKKRGARRREHHDKLNKTNIIST